MCEEWMHVLLCQKRWGCRGSGEVAHRDTEMCALRAHYQVMEDRPQVLLSWKHLPSQ